MAYLGHAAYRSFSLFASATADARDEQPNRAYAF